MRHAFVAAAIVTSLAGAPAGAQDGPVVRDGALVFPEGAAVPRHATDVELDWEAAHPRLRPKAFPPAPTGALRCTAEYEAVEAIVVAWEGVNSWKALLAAMAREITTVGDADVVVSVDTAAEQGTASAQIAAAGADMSRVRFLLTGTDSIWMRDYGPRYAYEGGARVIVDHEYNRPRPDDDDFPEAFAAMTGHARYDLPLVHGGGNFHLDALGHGFATRLIADENPALDEAGIVDLWRRYQGLDTTLLDAFPQSIDATRHLDMWLVFVSDTRVVISDWPFDAGSVQDRICDETAALLQGRGYEVFRVPARSLDGVHYTYTNMVLCNGLALIPSYSRPEMAAHEVEARATWTAAATGRTVVPMDCDTIVQASGVMHCIVMHVPPPLGGATPTAHLRWPAACETLVPGSIVDIDWLVDDDVGVVEVDLELSLDDGATWTWTIVASAWGTTTHAWTVPDLDTSRARVRVVARDADGNVGTDASDGSFAIGDPSGGPALGDPLLVTRQGASMTLALPASAAGASYNVYSGDIGALAGDAAAFGAFDGSECWIGDGSPGFARAGGSVAIDWPLPPSRRWFLVTASDCFAESALGSRATGARCGADR